MANYSMNRGRSSQGYGRRDERGMEHHRRTDRGSSHHDPAPNGGRACGGCGVATQTWSKSHPDLCLVCAATVARTSRHDYIELQEPAPSVPPSFLWAISIAAKLGNDYVHGAIYTVELDEQRAKAAGLVLARRDYPPDDGFSEHNAAVLQVRTEHIEQVMQ